MEKSDAEISRRKSVFTKAYFIRVIVFVLGIFMLALGAATVITANLGVSTWDVLHIGMSNLTGFSVGRWVQIIGIAMVLMTANFEKQRIAVGSLLNIIMIGFFMNMILDSGVLPTLSGTVPKTFMLLIGIVLMGTGSGMYVSSKVGAGPRDGMTLFLSRRFSISIRLSRTLLELTALTCGWLIGGPVALGTFLTVPLLGPIMQYSLKFCTSQLEKYN
jgi:uncharacterized protein